MVTSKGLRTVTCSPAQLLAAACDHVAAIHRSESPDLTRLTVVLPQLRARRAAAQALRSALGVPVLLLPRITTLTDWAAEVALPENVLADAAREAMLYQALLGRRWFRTADLWALASELAVLFDELTRWRVRLPASIGEFERNLQAAYQAGAAASFGFEARLVHELWHACAASGQGIDEEAARQVKLAKLAAGVAHPVYVVGLSRPTPAEREFLERCAERVPVTCFTADHDAMRIGGSAVECTLAHAWPGEAAAPALRERAMALRARFDEPALAGRLRFFGAHGLEEEAAAIAVCIRRWLAAGRRNIAVLVFDRVSARRARALLERAEILVRDEAGWPLSTTSAATVLSRWFDASASDFYHRELLDFLKSPYAFGDRPRALRQQAVGRLERALREANVRAGLERYIGLAERADDAELRNLLLDVRRAERLLERGRRKTIVAWLEACHASMARLGIRAALEADLAGRQLLDLLQRLAADLSRDGQRIDFAQFRRWLARRLESSTFRDEDIESPVVFTSLQNAALRDFDAVVVIGADAVHMPYSDAPTLFFNQGVRRELGLPGRTESAREMEESLAALIASTPEIVVTWQRSCDGEANLLAPVFERLRALHAMAWGDDLGDDAFRAFVSGAHGQAPMSAEVEPTRVPQPRVASALVPAAMSASAYNALMACPYQFFARYVLRLGQRDEIEEELQKFQYGTLVHEALLKFHAAHPKVAAMPASAAQSALESISRAAFEPYVTTDYHANAWLVRWLTCIPGYLAWQMAREADGWTFRAGEVDRSLEMETPRGRSLLLKGRIDRVDRGPSGSFALIDYKTQSRDVLRKKLKVPGEDVQLPIYVVLWGEEVVAALYLAVEDDEKPGLPAEGDLAALAQRVQARLVRLMDRIHDGVPLPANGIDQTCRFCEMYGLCRRQHWP